MSILEVFRNHKPVENPEFGAKKKLIGDGVCQIQSLEKITAKSGAPWIVLKSNVINAIPDPEGRETTLAAGDEIALFYDPSDAEALEALDNDLFTAGIDFERNVETEDALLASMGQAAKDKLVYVRTWAKDKTEEQKAKNPNKPGFFQNIVIKSKNLITPENSVPQLPF